MIAANQRMRDISSYSDLNDPADVRAHKRLGKMGCFFFSPGLGEVEDVQSGSRWILGVTTIAFAFIMTQSSQALQPPAE